ncbi:MAG: DUF4433 domain-containing protein [Candidatus Kapaibacterium sp.]|jgi:hypothetical protein|nr:DUF4433 domain-containing protein [Candidatus Kapabacteria bacterium]
MTQLFRITHINNLPFILENGLYCPNATIQDPHFTAIGFPSLIEYRRDRVVPIAPYGTLADYVPFYFWYRSPMLYVIYKGNDPEIIQTPQNEIVYIISSFESLQENNCRFIFTDRHAKLEYAQFFDNPSHKSELSWDIIKNDTWGRQYGADRKEKKQAECLVYQHVPIGSIIGIAVLNESSQVIAQNSVADANRTIPVKVKENFYF